MKVFTYFVPGTDILKGLIQLPNEQAQTFVPPPGFVMSTAGWDSFLSDSVYYKGLEKDLPENLREMAVHWNETNIPVC